MSTETLKGIRIHFWYHRAFKTIKEHALSVGILQAVMKYQREVAGTGCTSDHLLTTLKDTLGFNIDASPNTKEIYQNCIESLKEKNWLVSRVESSERAPDSGGKVIEVYSCTDKGATELERFNRSEETLKERAFGDFCELVYVNYHTKIRNDQSLAPAALDELLSVEQTQVDPTEWVCQLFRDLHHNGQLAAADENYELRPCFEEYLEYAGPLAVEQALRPIMGHFGDANDNFPEMDVGAHFHLAHLDSRRKRDQSDLLRHAILRAHKQIVTSDFGDAKALEQWLHGEACLRLLHEVWPFESDVRDWLCQNLKCIYIYPDTNVIIAALSPQDPRNDACLRIFQFLIDNHIKIIWDKKTEREFSLHLEGVKNIVSVLNTLPQRDIFRIFDSIQPPSLVRDYFTTGWRNWTMFERYVRDRYTQLKSATTQAVIEFGSIPDYARKVGERTSDIEEIIKNPSIKNPELIQHDAHALATVIVLRQEASAVLGASCSGAQVSLGSPFWFMTLDRRLIEKQKTIDQARLNPSGQQLILLFRTVFQFLEPHSVAAAFATPIPRQTVRMKLAARLIPFDPKTVLAMVQDGVKRKIGEGVAELANTEVALSRYIEGFNLESSDRLEREDQRRARVLGRSPKGISNG